MSEPQVVNTLRAKAEAIRAYISDLECKLEEARRDLAHVQATARIFQSENGGEAGVRVYMNFGAMFARLELPKLVSEALEAHPQGIDTRGIARAVLTAKGLDADDRHLCKAMAQKVIHLLSRWERQGRVQRLGKVKGAVIWGANPR